MLLWLSTLTVLSAGERGSYSLSSFPKNFKFLQEVEETLAGDNIHGDLIKYAVDLLPERLLKKVATNGKMLTLYKAPKKRLAYIYKRVDSLRFYMFKEDYVRMCLCNFSYNVNTVDDKEISFYVKADNLNCFFEKIIEGVQ